MEDVSTGDTTPRATSGERFAIQGKCPACVWLTACVSVLFLTRYRCDERASSSRKPTLERPVDPHACLPIYSSVSRWVVRTWFWCIRRFLFFFIVFSLALIFFSQRVTVDGSRELFGKTRLEELLRPRDWRKQRARQLRSYLCEFGRVQQQRCKQRGGPRERRTSNDSIHEQTVSGFQDYKKKKKKRKLFALKLWFIVSREAARKRPPTISRKVGFTSWSTTLL